MSGKDIESYREHYESDEHWKLRKTFIETYIDKFPEEKVLCWAAVFINITILGSKYPEPVMTKVNELVKGLPIADYKARWNQQKIMFVTEGSSNSQNNERVTNERFERGLHRASDSAGCSNIQVKRTFEQSEHSGVNKKNNTNISDLDKKSNFLLIDHSECLDNNKEEEKNKQILHWSAGFNELNLVYDYENCASESGEMGIKCRIRMGNEEIADGIGTSKQDSKAVSAEKAVNFLRKNVYTVKIKRQESEVFREDLIKDKNPEDEKVGESNIGHKLLQMMGWSGGGLGKNGTGISEPVTVKDVNQRRGLGSSGWNNKPNMNEFRQIVRGILQDYLKSDSLDDLVFSPGFDKEERKEIHTLSQRLGLKSKSRGQGEARYQSISRKLTPARLFNYLMTHGGSTNKYELIQPEH